MVLPDLPAAMSTTARAARRAAPFPRGRGAAPAARPRAPARPRPAARHGTAGGRTSPRLWRSPARRPPRRRTAGALHGDTGASRGSCISTATHMGSRIEAAVVRLRVQSPACSLRAAHDPQASVLWSWSVAILRAYEPHAAQEDAPFRPGHAFAAASPTPGMLIRTASTSARSTRTPAGKALRLSQKCDVPYVVRSAAKVCIRARVLHSDWRCDLISRLPTSKRTANFDLKVSPASHVQHAHCAIHPAKVPSRKARHICSRESLRHITATPSHTAMDAQLNL